MTIDAKALREQFPTLGRVIDGKRTIYLDSAASSQTPVAVLDAMDDYYRRCRSNVHRGVYPLAEEATEVYEGGRERLARFLGADPRGVVLTKNATEACNLIAHAYARRRLGRGDAVLSTVMEHHANLVPFTYAAADRGFEVRHVPITEEGLLDLEVAARMLEDGRVRLVTVVHVSNVLGTINDVTALAEMARRANPDVVIHVDGTQSAPHMPVDLATLGVDSYAVTGHKMLGPTGIGALVADPDFLDSLDPFLTGGEMIDEVTLEGSTWAAIPQRFEAGTPMIAESAGLGAAIDWLEAMGMDEVRTHERELTGRLIDALDTVDGVRIHGPRDPKLRGGCVSFSVDGVHPHDVGQWLGSLGVCVRVGHHCTKPLMRCLGEVATVRASVHVYNDEDDLEPLVDGLNAARDFFAR